VSNDSEEVTKSMKSFIYLVALFISLGLFPGCKSEEQTQKERTEETRRIMDSWMGHHKSELIRSWGPPTRYDSDGQGGQILIYEYTRTVGATIYGSYLQRTFVDYKEMFANGDGYLYYWRTGTR